VACLQSHSLGVPSSRQEISLLLALEKSILGCPTSPGILPGVSPLPPATETKSTGFFCPGSRMPKCSWHSSCSPGCEEKRHGELESQAFPGAEHPRWDMHR
jgi:hypothetical protein